MILILWQIVSVVQSILSYGTAYRLTKNGGDNGVSLFGWDKEAYPDYLYYK